MFFNVVNHVIDDVLDTSDVTSGVTFTEHRWFLRIQTNIIIIEWVPADDYYSTEN